MESMEPQERLYMIRPHTFPSGCLMMSRQTCTSRTSYEPHNNVATLLAYIRLLLKG